MAGYLVSAADQLSDDVGVALRLLTDQEEGAARPRAGEELECSRNRDPVGGAFVLGSVEPVPLEVTRDGVDVDGDAGESTRVGGDGGLSYGDGCSSAGRDIVVGDDMDPTTR